jgi:hypothetical protein
MSLSTAEFNRRAVRPVACFREGWQLIKDDYWLFLGITAVGMLIAGAFPPMLLGPMWCGIDICYLRRMDRRNVSFNNLFEGFNDLGPSCVATLIVLVLNVLVIMPIAFLYIVGLFVFVFPDLIQGGPPDLEFVAKFFGMALAYTFVATAASLLLVAPNIFMYALIVERRMPGAAAVFTSFKAILANFWGVLGLLLLYMLVHTAGTMLCIVGVYLVWPISFAAFAVAYRQVFPPLTPAKDLDEEPEPEESERPVRPVLPTAAPTTDIQTEATRKPASDTGITPGATPE